MVVLVSFTDPDYGEEARLGDDSEVEIFAPARLPRLQEAYPSFPEYMLLWNAVTSQLRVMVVPDTK